MMTTDRSSHLLRELARLGPGHAAGLLADMAEAHLPQLGEVRPELRDLKDGRAHGELDLESGRRLVARVLFSYGVPVALIEWNEGERRLSWSSEAAYSVTSKKHVYRWASGYGEDWTSKEGKVARAAADVGETDLRRLVAVAFVRLAVELLREVPA